MTYLGNPDAKHRGILFDLNGAYEGIPWHRDFLLLLPPTPSKFQWDEPPKVRWHAPSSSRAGIAYTKKLIRLLKFHFLKPLQNRCPSYVWVDLASNFFLLENFTSSQPIGCCASTFLAGIELSCQNPFCKGLLLQKRIKTL